MPLNMLVTAGNTQSPIDAVRCITNIFSGRTGGRIALEAHARGHAVTLLTSHPEVLPELAGLSGVPGERWTLHTYRTYEDLYALMEQYVSAGRFEAIIHAAAVSDYQLAGTYAPVEGTAFDPETASWQGGQLRDVQAGKVKSHHAELWLRLVPTRKIVDQIRAPWGFRGVLVKFKLEVGVTEEALRVIAEKSRQDSGADCIVANTLEGIHDWALLGTASSEPRRIIRGELPHLLLEKVEQLAAARQPL